MFYVIFAYFLYNVVLVYLICKNARQCYSFTKVGSYSTDTSEKLWDSVVLITANMYINLLFTNQGALTNGCTGFPRPEVRWFESTLLLVPSTDIVLKVTGELGRRQGNINLS
jgi:hypothetical protein